MPQHYMDRYTYGPSIGNGSFGQVHSAYRKLDNMHVAIKEVKLDDYTEFYPDEGDKLIPFEIYILKKLYHVPGVVKMLDYYVGKGHYYIVMQYAAPDLFDVLTTYKFFEEDICKKLFKDLLETVIAIREQGFMHNDIKTENLAPDLNNLTLKLFDFGLADFMKSDLVTKFRGTKAFAPPEWKEFKSYKYEPATVWTLGMFLYEISQGFFPQDFVKNGAKLSFVIPISKDMKDFLKNCLSKYYDRPSLDQLQEHPWLI